MKRKVLLPLVFCSVISLSALSQDGVLDTVYMPDGEMHTQKTAYYPGGSEAYYNDLVNKLKLPDSIDLDDIDGRVIVKITVNTEGKVENPQIVKGINAGVDSAVIKMTERLKQFEPATMDGKPVPLDIKTPLKF